MKTFLKVGLAGVLGVLAVPAMATPITENSFISITQRAQSLDPSNFFGNSTNSFYQNTLATGVSAYGNLSTGELGSQAGTPGSGSQSIVQIFDTLTFSTAANISFEYLLDGILSTNNRFGDPSGSGRVDIYDITGLSSWGEQRDIPGIFEIASVVSEATPVSINSVDIRMDSVTKNTSESGVEITNRTLASDGTEHSVESLIEGAFIADSDKVYGIRLAVSTTGSFVTSGFALSDFSDTGTFSFTDLGGSTFTSGSGAFLEAVDVPEPSTLALVTLGGVFAFLRRKRLA